MHKQICFLPPISPVLFVFSVLAVFLFLAACDTSQSIARGGGRGDSESSSVAPPGGVTKGVPTFSDESSAPQPFVEQVAFVIGNSNYRRSWSSLPNARRDAEKVGKELEKLGFKVIYGFDLAKRAFDEKHREFVGDAEDASVALFYFAGHGSRVGQNHFLIPVDAGADLSVKNSVPLTRIVDQLNDENRRRPTRRAQPRVDIVMLDACRDKSTDKRAFGGGLERGDVALFNGIIAFSAELGKVAFDQARAGDINSPYAAAVLGSINKPQVVERMLKDIRATVISETAAGQCPEYLSTWGFGEFSFVSLDDPAELKAQVLVDLKNAENVIGQLRADLERSKELVAGARGQAKDLRGEIESLEGQMKGAESDRGRLRERYTEMDRQTTRGVNKKELAEVDRRIDDLVDEIDLRLETETPGGNPELGPLLRQLRDAMQSKDHLLAEVQRLRQENASLRSDIVKLQNEVERLQQEGETRVFYILRPPPIQLPPTEELVPIELPDGWAEDADSISAASRRTALLNLYRETGVNVPSGLESPKTGIRFSFIPSCDTGETGCFFVGSGSQQGDSRFDIAVGQLRPATLKSPFYMSVSEITVAQYEAVMGTVPKGNAKRRMPVRGVSYADANAFCEALNRQASLPIGTYRLPDETEWTVAARTGLKREYAFPLGPRVAVFGGSQGPSPAKGRIANAWGLVDMHGNLREWCEAASDDVKPNRFGGSFASSLRDCSASSAVSGYRNLKVAYPDTGFRIVRALNVQK